jgi:hypothetical protein
MNPLALAPAGWSPRRLTCAIVGVFLAQVALLFWLGQRERPPPQRPTFPTGISLAVDEMSDTRFAQTAALDDPALLALPGLNGFSGAAWMRFEPLNYQPTESTEPPHWLALDDKSLGSTLSRFLEANGLPPSRLADKPLPPLQRFEPNYPNEPVPQSSRWRVEGELASRRLLAPLALKSWPHSEILSNTVVQAVIDADGYTISPTLLSGSGLAEADAYALKLTTEARWEPLPRAGDAEARWNLLTWGKLMFQWHTLPLPVTNRPAAPPTLP